MTTTDTDKAASINKRRRHFQDGFGGFDVLQPVAKGRDDQGDTRHAVIEAFGDLS